MLTAPAVNLLVCVFLCLALAWKLRREIQFRLILIPLIPYLISSALINLVVDRIDLKVLGILFGAFQLLLCLYYLLIAKRIKGRSTTTAGLVCGFFSGITASLFGVGGPLLAVFLLGASRSKESYTANMQFVFLITNAIIFVNKLIKGLFTLQLLPITVAGAVGVLLGQWFGTKLTSRLDADDAADHWAAHLPVDCRRMVPDLHPELLRAFDDYAFILRQHQDHRLPAV